MKTIFCFMLVFAGISITVDAQQTMSTEGPSFSKNDSSTSAVISVASLQSYPVGFDRQGTPKEEEILPSEVSSSQALDIGPIRDWSNPSGYMGYRKSVKHTKRKPMSVKKYQPIKRYRCYTF
jgi:hypothetical protein